MKKRIFSLFLCLLTVLMSFMMASCGEDEGELARKAALGDEDYGFTTTSKTIPLRFVFTV